MTLPSAGASTSSIGHRPAVRGAVRVAEEGGDRPGAGRPGRAPSGRRRRTGREGRRDGGEGGGGDGLPVDAHGGQPRMSGRERAVDVQDLRRSYGPVAAVDGATWSAAPGDGHRAARAQRRRARPRRSSASRAWSPHRRQRPRPGHATPGVPPPSTGPGSASCSRTAGCPRTVRPLPLLRHLASLHAAPRDVDDLAERLGIPAFARTTVRRMSGGQRQRVALAASLVGVPDVALPRRADRGPGPPRPARGLGRRARGGRAGLLRRRHDPLLRGGRAGGRPDVVIMAAGRVVADGRLDEVPGRAPPRGRVLRADRGGAPVTTSPAPATPARRVAAQARFEARHPARPTASSSSSPSCSRRWPCSGSRCPPCPTSDPGDASTSRPPAPSPSPSSPPRSPARPSPPASTAARGCSGCSAPPRSGAAACSRARRSRS